MYPKSYRVGDRVYRIKFVKIIRKDPRVMGLFDPMRIEILIKNDQSEDEKLKTLCHELLHAMSYEYEIKIKHRSIYALEEAFFDFICANSSSFFTK